MRQIVLDTETTGLDPSQGHRIIEIGGVEVVDRKLTGNHFHQYLQPDRDIDEGAMEVHGITNEFLLDKPRFSAVVDDFVTFVKGAELVIHNAPFDVGFINTELALQDRAPIEEFCTVLDTLVLAREMYPGQRNSLDALCKRLDIDNSQRTLHGALLDAEILADVYLLMTGGQVSLTLPTADESAVADGNSVLGGRFEIKSTPVITASAEEEAAHAAWLDKLESGGSCVWRQ